MQTAAIGKGRFLLGDDLNELLHAASVQRETMTDKALQFTRRKNIDGSDVYFIANRSNNKIDEWITLQTTANGVALYNPMTAASGVARFRKNKEGLTEVLLQLDIDESIIVQTSNKIITGNSYPYIKTKGQPEEIKGAWTLSFTDGGPALPQTVSMQQLQPWTDLQGQQLPVLFRHCFLHYAF